MYGFGSVYYDEGLASTVYFIVSLVLGIMIIFSEGFYAIETYEFFRKNAAIFLVLHLATYFISQDDPIVKAITLPLGKAVFVACFFWLILWFHHIRNNGNNGINSNNRRLRRT
jgi:hypothetical protein